MLKTNNPMKKLLSIVIALTMLIPAFSMCINASTSIMISTESVEIDGVTYTGVIEQTNNGMIKIIVSNNDNDEIVEMVRYGDMLQVKEIGDDVINSTIKIPQILESDILELDILMASRASSTSKDLWWDFYSHYNTNPVGTGGDVYWSIRKDYGYSYYADYGTSLMDYSDDFDYEVNQLIGWQYATIAITGAEVALTIAGLLTVGVIAAPALLLALLLALGTVATATVPIINAWSAAKEAEKHFAYIIDIIGS